MAESSYKLSAQDLENFLAHGFVHLTDCFDLSPGSLAQRWVKESWQRNGISPDDRSTWPHDKIHMPGTERVRVHDFSPRAFAAICELCGGEDRVDGELSWSNAFIANYGFGRDKEWVAPGPQTAGWHVDGDFFLHFLDSAEQGLLIVVLFSDIHPQGGGTFIACDSIPPITRHLASHPEGVRQDAFPVADAIKQCLDFRETTGKAGDVFILHPFTLHASSFNHRPEARLMINPTVMLREPMRFDRSSDGSAYSPIEKSVLRVLGKEHYDFKHTGRRRMIVPERVARQRRLFELERQRLAAGQVITPRVAGIFGIAGSSIIVAGSALAAIRYQGHAGELYSPLNHFVSELGQNRISAWAPVFNGSLVLGNLCLIVFALGLALQQYGKWKWALAIVGVTSALSAALVGVIPMNYLIPHLFVAMIFFYSGLVSAALYSFRTIRDSSGLRGCWNALPSAFSALCFVAFLIETIRLSGHLKEVIDTFLHHRPQFWLPPILEWLVFLSVMLWVTLAAWQLYAESISPRNPLKINK